MNLSQGVKKLFIEPGSPLENGYIESLNLKLRDELLNRGIFTTFTKARILIDLFTLKGVYIKA